MKREKNCIEDIGVCFTLILAWKSSMLFSTFYAKIPILKSSALRRSKRLSSLVILYVEKVTTAPKLWFQLNFVSAHSYSASIRSHRTVKTVLFTLPVYSALCPNPLARCRYLILHANTAGIRKPCLSLAK